ncbi:MAG: hypothetical protein IPM25_12765 [Chloracidobacterium sp.]|nr:hypothetical protein [Chloracidobacterium sp.]
MKYWTYERTSGGIREKDFLGEGAKQYLETCEDEVYHVWLERVSHSADVSLANTLSRTIKRKFDDRTIRLAAEVSEIYGISWMFQHRNDTSGKFLELYREAHVRKIIDFLVITQTPEFKNKFQFDGSTMTFESICDDYDDFVEVLRPQHSLRLFFLVFADMNFNTSRIEKGRGTALQLHPIND